MISSTFCLFSQINLDHPQLLQEIASPKLQNTFTVNKTEITLILTDHYLVLTQPHHNKPTHFCTLTFDLKFQTIYQPIPNQSCIGIPLAIKFQRQNCTEELTFHASHPAIAEKWSIELEKKINQRNFHKLFKAKKKIGKGAFATVYLAVRLRDQKLVAVKAFSKEKQYSGDKGKQSLQNEIKIMRTLNHQNVMKLEGVYQTQNSIYVILEYLEGQQLNEVLKNKKIEPHQAKLIIQNILRGLSHLSKHRIIHRDLKPQNIMFKKDHSWDLAICDYGLATDADEQMYLFVRCGTPGFVAPQIINIRDMTTKSDTISDVFSVGIIFHYLLFGCSIFRGRKYNQILTQNRACQLSFNRQMYGKINSTTFDLLTKMLEKDPSKRITADAALNHSYFTTDMDIQYESKPVFKDTSLIPYPFKVKQIEETTTNVSKKTNQTNYMFNSIWKEEPKYIYQ